MPRSLLLALLVVGGCASAPPRDAPRTVPAVDLVRYAGVWHEAARFPNRFQDGYGVSCADTTATYTPRPDGRVGVVNRCRNAAAGGAERVVKGSAYAVDESNGSRLRVSFFWPFYGGNRGSNPLWDVKYFNGLVAIEPTESNPRANMAL